MKPTFFKSQAGFRKWLEKNHGKLAELWVGLQKKGSAQKGLVYKEALDEALCFGWIDGVRKSIDAWYRRLAQFWVMSAKKEETRSRRLALLIESSEKGKRAPPFPQLSDTREQ